MHIINRPAASCWPLSENEQVRKKNEIACSGFMIRINCQKYSFLFPSSIWWTVNLFSPWPFCLLQLLGKQENRNFIKESIVIGNFWVIHLRYGYNYFKIICPSACFIVSLTQLLVSRLLYRRFFRLWIKSC